MKKIIKLEEIRTKRTTKETFIKTSKIDKHIQFPWWHRWQWLIAVIIAGPIGLYMAYFSFQDMIKFDLKVGFLNKKTLWIGSLLVYLLFIVLCYMKDRVEQKKFKKKLKKM